MKKILSFTLAIVMCLSLCACGGNGGTAQSEDTTEEIDKNSTETYVGAWAYDTGKGNVITYHFNKGGIGYYEQATKENAKWEFTWEVKDGVVVTTRNAIGTTFLESFELNDEDGALYQVSEGTPVGPYLKK